MASTRPGPATVFVSQARWHAPFAHRPCSLLTARAAARDAAVPHLRRRLTRCAALRRPCSPLMSEADALRTLKRMAQSRCCFPATTPSAPTAWPRPPGAAPAAAPCRAARRAARRAQTSAALMMPQATHCGRSAWRRCASFASSRWCPRPTARAGPSTPRAAARRCRSGGARRTKNVRPIIDYKLITAPYSHKLTHELHLRSLWRAGCPLARVRCGLVDCTDAAAGSACPAVVRAAALDQHRRACPFRTVRNALLCCCAGSPVVMRSIYYRSADLRLPC